MFAQEFHSVPQSTPSDRIAGQAPRLRVYGPLLLALVAYLILGAYQLELPGLHYDEAKEAGLNAMQLLTGQPVTAFRGATVALGPWRLPLMVQDYIGSLNVLLALPFLAVGGVSVAALRWLPLLIGGLTLLVTWRVALRLGGASAAGVTALLMAVNPSWLFWSRQGIFVTNLTAFIFMASLLIGLRWWVGRRPRDLWLTALLWGLGVYAKLLFVWAIGAMVALAGVAWVVDNKVRGAGYGLSKGHPQPPISISTWSIALLCFLLPLGPLILFNIQTGGTLISIFSNLGQSYYGVDNTAYLPNLLTRARQIVTLLRGDHFWYMGEVYANRWAPWLAGVLSVAALTAGLFTGRRVDPRRALPAVLLPMALLALIVAQSAFTVSDLFITHYILLLPLLPLAAGLAAATLWQRLRGGPRGGGRPVIQGVLATLVIIAVVGWGAGDLWNTLAYHRMLTASGGYTDHSDAIMRLAAGLTGDGQSAPVALDWGMDAPIRFLTAGRVNPVEVFGYTRRDAPDEGFAGRVTEFLRNPDNVYLAHVPGETKFQGRVEALAALAQTQGLVLKEILRATERSGRPLFIVYRAVKTQP